MAEMIPINIIIGDRNYRIKTEPKDEEAIRKGLKLINDKIIEFKTHFAGKDMQDYIAMVLIWYATRPSADDPVLEKEFVEILSRIEGQLDKVLLINP